MTAHFANFTHEYGIRPQLEAEAVRRKRDAKVRAVFWWTAIVVGLLFWAAITYGISLLSLNVLAS
jgi:phenylalanine-4-hydroxylase